VLTVEEARRTILGSISPCEITEIRVGEAAGMVLAKDQVADHPLPRFDNSAMDGYAVRSEDVAKASESAPIELEVTGEVRAGSAGDAAVGDGQACRIMTGAPVPPGADAVVPVEDTDEREGRVSIRVAPAVGRHIRPAGDDLAAGDLLVAAGEELGAGEIALLASLGCSPIPVFSAPRVAVLVTGDELVAPESEVGPGQIRDSNSIALAALVREAGGEPITFPAVRDDRNATVEALRRAAEAADMIVSSGGVAVGRYDFVKEAVEELGRIDLWRVAMQPGKPVVFGSIEAKPFLGLPGNPVSIHISFEQFVRPAIRKMRGCRTLLRPLIKARLASDLKKPAGRQHFVRVRLSRDGYGWLATPTGPQGSHIQSSLVGCDGAAIFPIDETELKSGEEVSVELWRVPGRETP
jgi:molybdopterin molybdotransferase